MTLLNFLQLTMSLTAIFIMAICSTTSYAANKEHNLSQQQVVAWREDIEYLQQTLEQRHIHLYHRINKTHWSARLDDIKKQLPSLNGTRLMIELMKVVKQIGDGHTQFSYWGGNYHGYPLHLQMFGDELRVIGIANKYPQLLGSKIHAINDIPITQVRQLLIPVLQGVENSYSERQRLIETITIAEVLHGLNIASSITKALFTFELPNGKMQNIVLNSFAPDQLQKQPMISINMNTPHGFTRDDASINGIELFLNHADHIVYMDFYQYPQYSEMEIFCENLIKILSKGKMQKVIIDLRNNSGGDFFVGLHLAWALITIDNLHWKDGIYVLTSGKTFSASMSNAVQYRQLLNATLVGEPTGSNPTGYQDADSFLLPNSGWRVQYSKRLYRFQEKSDGGVTPDIHIAQEWSSYSSGLDNQLDWILNTIYSQKNKN